MAHGSFRLFRIPLNSSYDHTFYFSSVQAQTAYFNTCQTYPSTAGSNEVTTFLRISRNCIKAQVDYYTASMSNYIFLKDRSVGNRTYYAFITSIEYINDETTIINFQIDVIQSFLISGVIFKPSFVEREHTTSDDIGDHLLPEPIADNDLITQTITRSGYMNAWSLVLLNTFKQQSGTTILDDVYLDMVNGSLMPLYPMVFDIITDVDPNTGVQIDATELAHAVSVIEDLIKVQGKIDGIHKAFLYPTEFIDLSHTNVEIKSKTLSSFNQYFQYNGETYTPKNNKTLTYPFNYLEVDNGTDSIQFRYEFLNDPPQFYFYGTLSPQPNILCKVYSSAGNYNYLNNITLNNFPEIYLDKSLLNEWVQSGGNIQASNLMFNALSRGMSSLNAFGAASSAGSNISNVAQGAASGLLATFQEGNAYSMTIENYRRKGDAIVGNYNVTISHDLGLVDFFFKQVQIKPKNAKVIDDYFTKYGYRVDTIKIPTLNNRPYYTFIKTAGLNIYAPHLQDDYIKQIKQIFDNGITFWRDTDKFMDYSVNNSPSSN